MTCPDCERHKLSASMWRNKAYEASGTPLPWNPEELLLKEYERGRADGAVAEREVLRSVMKQMIDAYTLSSYPGGFRPRGEAK